MFVAGEGEERELYVRVEWNRGGRVNKMGKELSGEQWRRDDMEINYALEGRNAIGVVELEKRLVWKENFANMMEEQEGPKDRKRGVVEERRGRVKFLCKTYMVRKRHYENWKDKERRM